MGADVATIKWKGLTGDWTTAADWNTAIVPVSGDDVFFNSGASGYTVTVSTAVSVGSLAFSDNGATLVENSGASLTLSGTLAVTGGGTLELDGTTTVGSLLVEGGKLTGSGDITDTGAFTWSTGTITSTSAA